MESPLFEIISKTKNFENKYTIYIDQKIIDEYKYVYKKVFDNLNKSNIIYSLIYHSYYDKNIINFLNELNIDYNKIKRLKLIKRNSKEDIEKENDNNHESSLSKKLVGLDFNFKELKEIDLSWNNISDIKILEKVNFEKLEHLDLGN